MPWGRLSHIFWQIAQCSFFLSNIMIECGALFGVKSAREIWILLAKYRTQHLIGVWINDARNVSSTVIEYPKTP